MKQLMIATVGWKQRLSHTHTPVTVCYWSEPLLSCVVTVIWPLPYQRKPLFFKHSINWCNGFMKMSMKSHPKLKKIHNHVLILLASRKKHWLDLVFLIKVVICKSIIYFSLINRHCKITGWNKMWWRISEWWPEMVQRFTSQGWRLWSGVTFLKQSRGF